MTTLLHRYIVKTIIAATALVLIVMIALTVVVNLLDELKDVGSGDYNFVEALIHVFLILPHNLYQFFPMLVLMGGVLGLGTLASHQELMVMRTAGFSLYRITVAVLAAACILTVIATIVGEVIVPQANYIAANRKQNAYNSGQAIASGEGMWMHEGNNFLHIDRIVGLHHIEGLTRFQFNANHQLVAAYYVKSLDRAHHQWILHDMLKTTVAPQHTHSEIVGTGTWDLVLNPNLLNVGLNEPTEMSLLTLHEYATHLKQNGLQAAEFQWEFWHRVFQPLTTLTMIVLAIPFVLQRSRVVTMGWRVLFGIIVGFSFYILNAFVGQFSIVFQCPAVIAALLPTVLFGIIGAFSIALTEPRP